MSGNLDSGVIERGEPSGRPLVTVLVCTRDRRDNVVPTLSSIRQCGYSNFELFLLDQSVDDATERAVAAAFPRPDPRLKIVRLSRPGKPLALNEGLRRAQGQYILLTDDDCEVLPGWIDAMVNAFQAEPRVGCIYGAVDAAPHDAAAGYIPDRSIEGARTIIDLKDLLTMPGWGNFGMGASMAVRADVVRALGGWDTCIGPGTKFGSGDDTDLAVRTLRAGHALHFLPGARVLHYGFRYWKSARRDLSRIAFGLGSVFAKHARSGAMFWGGARPAYFFARQSIDCLLKAQRPAGAVFVASWCRGFWAGMRQPIDRKANTFVQDTDALAYASHVAEVVLRSDQTSVDALRAGQR
jgi:GT2 family glycosyltransferase